MATRSDTSYCIIEMSEWNSSATASSLSTVVVDTDLSFNAIVHLTLPVGFAKAFQMQATTGYSENGNITPAKFLTKVADVSMNPYQEGIVTHISTGCIAQINKFYKSPPLKGASLPALAFSGVPHLAEDHISADYLGYLGYACFGNVQACNLFTTTSVTDYAGKFPGYDASFNQALYSSIVNQYSPLGGNGMATDPDDASFNEYSAGYKIYRQLVDNVPQRFDASYNHLYKVNEETSDNLYYLPIQIGDVFQFTITVSAASGQPTFGFENGATAIEDRIYLIRAIVGADVPGTPQANPENGFGGSNPSPIN